MVCECDKIRIGMIGRCDNRGLGNQSLEFYEHMDPCKVLIVMFRKEVNYKGRYPEAKFVMDEPSLEDIGWLLDGIDVLVGFETFYNVKIPELARRVGVKTVLRSNWEWLDDYGGEGPDLYLAPSLWHYNDLPEPKKYLPAPVNRVKLPFKLRSEAKVFLHNAGNGRAGYDRNGTDVVMRAIPLVQSDVRFIIKSQGHVVRDIGDSRVEYVGGDVKEYHEGWPKADVLVYPRRYGGLSLMLNEAMSLGMVPLMTNMGPQNEVLHEDLLIDVKGFTRLKINNAFQCANVSPEAVARKIDWIAGRNIEGYSLDSGCVAEDISWRGSRKSYRYALKDVVRGYGGKTRKKWKK